MPSAVHSLVAALRQAGGDAIAAVLFYGSCRRTGDTAGLLDLYVLHDGHRAFHRRSLPALLNTALPPNVILATAAAATDTPLHIGQTDGCVRAKVAIMSRRQFARRTRPGSLDTTIWARFCQPCSAAYIRDAAVQDWLAQTIAAAAGTAALWAMRLTPDAGATSATRWQNLFRHTYAAELRPEGQGRAAEVYTANASWFDATLAAHRTEPGRPEPGRDAPDRRCPGHWRRAWMIRRYAGRSLNLLRLAKAAFTFTDGAAYIAWKIERHTGRRLELTAWQLRHPLLAAPLLAWRLRRTPAGRAEP